MVQTNKAKKRTQKKCSIINWLFLERKHDVIQLLRRDKNRKGVMRSIATINSNKIQVMLTFFSDGTKE